MFKKFLHSMIILVMLSGCDQTDTKTIYDQPSVKPIDLSNLNLNSNNVRLLTLNSTQLNLMSEIENNEIQSETLIESLLLSQKKLYLSYQLDPNLLVPTETELSELINDHLTNIDLNVDLNTLKNNFENELTDAYGPLVLDEEHLSIWSILKDQNIQNQSGTILFEMIRLLRPESLFENDNRVVIFSNSEILSGQLIWENSKGYRLKGIKFNGDNLNEIDFGFVDSLVGIRVVDLDIFLITEIFKNQITNPLIVFKNGLFLTAEKYNLPLDQMESTIENPILKLNYENFDSEAALTLNLRLKDPKTLSIFSFGY